LLSRPIGISRTTHRPHGIDAAARESIRRSNIRLGAGVHESAFTHANVGRLTRYEVASWALERPNWKRGLFPLETLILLPETLAQFIREERN